MAVDWPGQKTLYDCSGLEKHHRELATLVPHTGGAMRKAVPNAEFDRLTALQMRNEGFVKKVATETI